MAKAIYINEAGFSDPKYILNSPSTVTVGGLTSATVLTGRTVMEILQDVLAPYIAPTFSVFAVNITSPIEVGAAVSGTKAFTWTTTTSPNVKADKIGICEVGGALLGSGLANDGSETLDIGTKINTIQTTWTWRISGETTQAASFTKDVSKCSIYPIYYGKVTSGSRPAVTNTLITTTCIGKSVVNSSGTVTATFSSSNQWTWIAIPSVSTTKTVWYVSDLNTSAMLVGGSKYPDECIIPITSAQSCWTGIDYKIYMSGFSATDNDPIQFRNS